MKTTAEIKNTGVNRLFKSNINSTGKIKISVVCGMNAKNYHDSELLYQNTFKNWREIPENEFKKINDIIHNTVIYRLKNIFKCQEDQELALKISVAKSQISRLRKNGFHKSTETIIKLLLDYAEHQQK